MDTTQSILKGKAAVISFRADGSVEMMQDDKIGLSHLGNQSIRRATEIRWNEEGQHWEIELLHYDSTGRKVASTIAPQARGFASYNEARIVEVRWLTLARARGVMPGSQEGKSLLESARAAVLAEA